MSDASETAFEANAQRFYGYGHEIRGYVRYAVLHRNLEFILCGENLHIADVGGGSAIDAIWAAQFGHSVTLIEPAEAQLTIARQRLEDAPTDVRQRITLLRGTTADVMEDYKDSFDFVFSHGVAMYLNEPGVFVNELVQLAKPGGHVSLLEKGYHGTEARLITERKFDQLKVLQATHRVTNNQERNVQAFLPDDLIDMLVKAGAHILDWSGVRVISDSMHDKVKDMSPGTLAAIVDAEYEQGRDPNIRGQGQMLHVIAQKPS